MRILTTDPLFPWDKLPDSPDLQALRQLFQLLPDQPLLQALRAHRGRGRNDYDLQVLWHIHLARYFLRHASMEAALGELARNPALRRVVGLEEGRPLPDSDNMSRFQEVLGLPEHHRLMQQMFHAMSADLARAVGSLGRRLAGDSAALCARASRARGSRPAGQPDGRGPTLPGPSEGQKDYQDENGQVVRTFKWSGYKFHLLVDTHHEVIVTYHVTSASGEGTGDCSILPLLLQQAQAVLPAGRMQTLAYDMAADDHDTHALLAELKIRPLIQIRELWREQPERVLGSDKGAQAPGNVVYDEAGTIWCYDTVSAVPVKRKMSYIGHEKERGTLKYRCPARHEGWSCPSEGKCNGASSYGKTVRVRCELDLRRFPPIPRATARFEQLYKGRTAVERVNARVKVFWGADDGNVAGAARFHAHLDTIMLVHASMAHWLVLQPRYEGKSLSPTRLSVIARKLEEAGRRRRWQAAADAAVPRARAAAARKAKVRAEAMQQLTLPLG